MFSDYLRLGIEHILDTNGYDHILFVTVLCSLYIVHQWKHVLVLVTAFTVGHSLTLALSSLQLLSVSPPLVEKLIPVTIILTGILNIYVVQSNEGTKQKLSANYFLALGFGLIHGLGFSNYFKAILGNEESILQPLLAFNLGVEVGQVVIVSCIMLLSALVIQLMGVQKKYWTTVLSLIGIIMSVYLLFF